MAACRLFCIPHAGGAAGSYRKWRRVLSPEFDVIPLELAGRGTRAQEPYHQQVEACVEDLYRRIRAGCQEDAPYVVLGHSMGSLLAYELVHRIQQDGAPMPSCVVLSGRRAPHHELEKFPLHETDEELIREVAAYGGVSQDLMKSGMAELFWPVLRADLTMMQQYRLEEERERLDCDFLVLYGEDDALAVREQVEEWGRYTSGTCEVFRFDGGHFFLHDHVGKVARLIASKLGSCAT